MNQGFLKCPDCGSIMVLREGPFGEFYGCSRYPKCEGKRNVKEGVGKILMPSSKCIRCGEYESLSEMGLCPYCQSVWDKD